LNSHLKPGGYLELACVWPVPGCDDATLPANCAYVEVCQTFQEIAAKIKADPDAPLHFHEYLCEAGFTNVCQTVWKIPTSPWPKDRRLKRVGADGRRRGLLAPRLHQGVWQNKGGIRDSLDADAEGVDYAKIP
jgi:hypothetical protein